MGTGRPNGRPSKDALRIREQTAVRDTIQKQAEAVAADALDVLARAVKVKPIEVEDRNGKTVWITVTPPSEQIAAAKYLLDQVIGSPGKKDTPDTPNDRVTALISELREVRRAESA